MSTTTIDRKGSKASIVSAAHLTAVEKIGTRLDNCFTAEEAIRLGHLGNWNVRKLPMYAYTPDGEELLVPGKFAIVRDNPFEDKIDVLGTAGSAYTAVQNEQLAELLNALVDESGANYELAGSADGGRKVFLSMRLPGHIQVGGVDPVNNSIAAFTGHDGSMSLTLMVLPIRYACGNVLNTKFRGRSNIIRVRHTGGVHANLHVQAREALDLSFKYLKAFQQQAERMIETTMTQTQFEQIITREYGAGFGTLKGCNPDDVSVATRNRATKTIEQMSELFADAGTQEGIRDTAWAGFNALTEWSDHYFKPRTKDDPETSRAERALLQPAFKQEALELMLAG